MWLTLQPAGMAKLMKAAYQGETLVSWILFKFNNVLFYSYGTSSSLHRELMASNLIMWEAIRLGKRLGCSVFDLWGSLGPDPSPKDPWFGFHRFKAWEALPGRCAKVMVHRCQLGHPALDRMLI